MGKYDYKELLEKALNGTKEDRIALVEWFERYGDTKDWNGERWYCEPGLNLKPIIEMDEETDCGELVDAEFTY